MNDNSNIPELRFKEFQKPWEVFKLKELTSRVKLKNSILIFLQSHQNMG